MGEIAEKMRVKLQLKGRSQNTVDAYLRYARAFVAFHMRPPQEMGEQEVRAWLQHRVPSASMPDPIMTTL
jgi:hypothetical protein